MLNKKAVPIMRGQIIKAFGAWFNPTYKYPSHAKPYIDSTSEVFMNRKIVSKRPKRDFFYF